MSDPNEKHASARVVHVQTRKKLIERRQMEPLVHADKSLGGLYADTAGKSMAGKKEKSLPPV